MEGHFISKSTILHNKACCFGILHGSRTVFNIRHNTQVPRDSFVCGIRIWQPIDQGPRFDFYHAFR